jgi:hypothetical protein
MSNCIRVYGLLFCSVVIPPSIFSHSVQAELITYEYTGPVFDYATGSFTTSDSITGTMTIDAPTGPGTAVIGDISAINFSVTHAGQPGFSFDGVASHVVDGSQWLFVFELDFSGSSEITSWTMGWLGDVTGDAYAEVLTNISHPAMSCGPDVYAERGAPWPFTYYGVTSSPGVWQATAVPEPSAFLCVGLVGLGLLGLKRPKPVRQS